MKFEHLSTSSVCCLGLDARCLTVPFISLLMLCNPHIAYAIGFLPITAVWVEEVCSKEQLYTPVLASTT